MQTEKSILCGPIVFASLNGPGECFRLFHRRALNGVSQCRRKQAKQPDFMQIRSIGLFSTTWFVVMFAADSGGGAARFHVQ